MVDVLERIVEAEMKELNEAYKTIGPLRMTYYVRI